jgi:glucose-6-phosphate dehydrogenase assembly protein OpcA
VTAIQPEHILRELADLWASMAKPEHGAATQSGVLRACAMTLIVAAADSEDAQNIGETIGQLMHQHPSRAIVLKPSGGDAELDARVFAQCWMPFGGRQQVCCEEIELTASHDRVGDLAGVILGLLAPDLPKVLWVRGPDWFQSPQFRHLFPLIDKLILDSRVFPAASDAFAVIHELRQLHRHAADLAWTGLTGWREIIAQTLEPQANREQAAGVAKVRIAIGDNAPPTPACYLAAWLARALPRIDIEIAREAGKTDIHSVALTGPDFEYGFRMGDGTVEVKTPAGVHAAMIPEPTDYSVMREELSITGADPVFDAVSPAAEQLAREHL